MEEIMVIENNGAYGEGVFYCGNSELEAYSKYRSMKKQNKKVNIVRAKVSKKLIDNVPFIWSYDIIEYIK